MDFVRLNAVIAAIMSPYMDESLSPRDAFCNTAFGRYSLQLAKMLSESSCWFLHSITYANLLSLTDHMVAKIICWPWAYPFFPRKQQERIDEHTFDKKRIIP